MSRPQPVYVVTRDDVGQHWVRIGKGLREYPGGRVLPLDIGKFLFNSDGVLQMESEDQFRRRVGV